MTTNLFDRCTKRERQVIDDALRIYLGEIAGNCAAAEIAERLREELQQEGQTT
jgi:hypothetical protein